MTDQYKYKCSDFILKCFSILNRKLQEVIEGELGDLTTYIHSLYMLQFRFNSTRMLYVVSRA